MFNLEPVGLFLAVRVWRVRSGVARNLPLLLHNIIRVRSEFCDRKIFQRM